MKLPRGLNAQCEAGRPDVRLAHPFRSAVSRARRGLAPRRISPHSSGVWR